MATRRVLFSPDAFPATAYAAIHGDQLTLFDIEPARRVDLPFVMALAAQALALVPVRRGPQLERKNISHTGQESDSQQGSVHGLLPRCEARAARRR